MIIGTIDIPTTKKLQKSYERKIADQERVSRARTVASGSNTVDIDFSDTESESDSVNDGETNIVSSSSILRNNKSQRHLHKIDLVFLMWQGLVTE